MPAGDKVSGGGEGVEGAESPEFIARVDLDTGVEIALRGAARARFQDREPTRGLLQE